MTDKKDAEGNLLPDEDGCKKEGINSDHSATMEEFMGEGKA